MRSSPVLGSVLGVEPAEDLRFSASAPPPWSLSLKKELKDGRKGANSERRVSYKTVKDRIKPQ